MNLNQDWQCPAVLSPRHAVVKGELGLGCEAVEAAEHEALLDPALGPGAEAEAGGGRPRDVGEEELDHVGQGRGYDQQHQPLAKPGHHALFSVVFCVDNNYLLDIQSSCLIF